MKRFKKMFVFLILTVINNYTIPILAKSQGGVFVIMLVTIPLMTMCYAMIFSTVHGFSFVYPLTAALLTLPVPLLFLGMSAAISFKFTAAIFVITLIGCLIGTLFYKLTNAIYRIPNKKHNA